MYIIIEHFQFPDFRKKNVRNHRVWDYCKNYLQNTVAVQHTVYAECFCLKTQKMSKIQIEIQEIFSLQFPFFPHLLSDFGC